MKMRENWFEKKAPFPTGCGKVNFVSKGCIYWRSANFWKFCGFPLKQLGFWSKLTVQQGTLLNCVVKYSSVLLSLYFRRYPFFSMCVEPSFFSHLFLIVYQLFVSCRSILICILYYYYDFLQSVYRFFTSRKLFHYM